MRLRPYQTRAVEGIAAAHRAGHTGVLLVIPTGGGKTVIFSSIIAALSGAGAGVLVLVSADELVKQTSDKLGKFGVTHGIIAAKWSRNPRPSANVQIAMVHTLRQRPRAMLRFPNYIIIDEADLACADSYQIILARYPGVRVLGVTATPFRLDNRPFSWATAIVEGPRISAMVAEGNLIPYRTLSLPITDLARRGRRAREFSANEIAKAYTDGKLIGDVVAHFVEHAASRSTLCFASSVEHSKALCAEFVAAGFVAEHLDGTTPPELRAAILQRLDAGHTQIVCNFGVLTAGFDCPRVSCCIIARPTQSRRLWIQMGGRCLRLCPEIGKVDALILDHGGNAIRHGNLGYHHTYSLDGRDIMAKDDAAGALGRECPICLVINDPSALTCEYCGHEFAVKKPAERASIDTVDGQLVEVAEDLAPVDLFAMMGAESPRRAPTAARAMRAERIESARAFAASWGRK